MTRTHRIAVVGAGPAGMYAVEHLLERRGLDVSIDLYDRLPTPWGLVRAGVAPDHPEKKLIIDRQFDFLLKNPRVSFIGNVEVGRDIQHQELAGYYDAIVYTVGAASDVRMGIPGEGLEGVWAAREFVAFYNGHPDSGHLKFDLSHERALIVGNGNVALDLARLLTMPVAELQKTDIADHALSVLRHSAVREVVVLGRRSPLEAAFNNPEFEELEHLQGVDVLIEGVDLARDADAGTDVIDWVTKRKIACMRRLAARPTSKRNKRIVFRFLTSPTELKGTKHVTQVVVVRNRLERGPLGNLQAIPTDERSILDAGLVFRAIGYRGASFPGLPFDHRRGVIQNHLGRVTDNNAAVPGAYVAGWIKRGCRGIIGSNKKCARETIECLLEDLKAGSLHQGGRARSPVITMLKGRKPDLVLLNNWLAIDRAEREAGRRRCTPRVKMTTTESLLACALATTA